MKPIIVAILMLFVERAEAQSTDPIKPIEPSSGNQTQQTTPNLHLDDWKKGMPPPAPTTGVTIYFDYTKFFEWLLPKKHPKIPRECDPMYFLQDSILHPPEIKDDTVRAIKPPV